MLSLQFEINRTRQWANRLRTARTMGAGQKCFMNKVVIMNGAVITASVAILTAAMLKPAAAELYPYCAWYTDKSTNCGFPSLWSCQASVSGVGGYCGVNPRWAAQRPPAPSGPARYPSGRVPPPPSR